MGLPHLPTTRQVKLPFPEKSTTLCTCCNYYRNLRKQFKFSPFIFKLHLLLRSLSQPLLQKTETKYLPFPLKLACTALITMVLKMSIAYTIFKRIQSHKSSELPIIKRHIILTDQKNYILIVEGKTSTIYFFTNI
jgi:hypothetical protein